MWYGAVSYDDFPAMIKSKPMKKLFPRVAVSADPNSPHCPVSGTDPGRFFRILLSRSSPLIGFCFLLGAFLTACHRPPVVNLDQGGENNAAVETGDSRPPLRIAVAAMISPENTRAIYDELLKLVAGRLGRRAVFVQRRSYAEVNALLKARKIELAFVCSGPYVEGHDDFGVELLAVPVVDGETVYHSFIIAEKNRAIHSFRDLRGHRFAFTDPNSNTGYLYPIYRLSQKAEDPTHFFSDTFFTHSHDASIHAVATGLADGAAVDSIVWNFWKIRDPIDASRVRVIEVSPPFGIPPVVVHPALDETLKERLREIFLGIDQDPEGKELLRGLGIDAFRRGEDASYTSIREMLHFLSSSQKELQ